MMQDAIYSKRQQKTRLAFMNAFVHLVMERGFDRVTVTDIANAADYGRWAFYQYFESKEHIALATFEHWMQSLDAQVVNSVRALEPPYREYESWRILITAFDVQRAFLMQLNSVMLSAWRVRAKEYLIAQFQAHIDAGLYRLMDGVRPEIAARLTVVALMELLETWGQNPMMGDSDTLADEFYTYIFNEKPPRRLP